MCKGVYTARVTVFRGSESRAAGESAELGGGEVRLCSWLEEMQARFPR
ncbi:MAG: hypothetical protein MSR67_08570 [Oscillospiraceae bacterium]|nr:hypothetical protein [Oscillospiraceae bacterium]